MRGWQPRIRERACGNSGGEVCTDTRIRSREWRERGNLRVIRKEQAPGVDDAANMEPGEPRFEAELSGTMGSPAEAQPMRMEKGVFASARSRQDDRVLWGSETLADTLPGFLPRAAWSRWHSPHAPWVTLESSCLAGRCPVLGQKE